MTRILLFFRSGAHEGSNCAAAFVQITCVVVVVSPDFLGIDEHRVCVWVCTPGVCRLAGL